MRTRKLRRGGQGVTKKNVKEFKAKTSVSERAAKTGKEKKEQKQARLRDAISGPAVPAAATIDTCGNVTQNRLMNYHLWADMIHDHGNNLLAIANPLFGVRAVGLVSNEDEVVRVFKREFPAIQNDVRVKNIVRFTVENKTELFPSQGPAAFVPFEDTPNNSVGVLQDAGFLLFRAMGAQNVITFGSVLDQAGKPCGKNDSPIAYIPDARVTLDIRPCTYGFNESAVRNIKISRFIGGMNATCKFTYIYRDREFTGGTPDEGLQINKLGGDFKSITQIGAIGPEKDKFAGYIGKALGDISLVASLQESVGGTPNVFYPGGRDMTYIKEPARTPKPVITKLLLNTGDRLNHIRAYAFGVGSVYSSSSGGFRNFEYIPGVSADGSPVAQFRVNLTRIKLLIETVDRTYEELIMHIIGIRDSGDMRTHSLKSGLPLISNPDHFSRARQMLDNIVNILEVFRVYALYHFINQYTKYEIRAANIATEPLLDDDVQSIKESYEMLLRIIDTVRPAAVSTKNSGGRDILNVISILKTINLGIFEFEITNTPTISEGTISKPLLDGYMARIRPDRRVAPIKAYPVKPNGEMKGSQTFYITNIYQLIGKGARIGEPYSNIFSTFSFGGRALNEIVGGGTVGGQELIEIFAQPFARPTKSFTPIPEPDVSSDVDIDILNDYRASGLGASIAFNAYNTYKEYPPSIIDPQLLQQVMLAYYNSVGIDGETDLIYDYVKKPDYSDAISSPDSLMFNVWSLYYNATIARSRSEDFEYEDNELTEYLVYFAEQLRSLYGGDIPSPNVGYVDSPQKMPDTASTTPVIPGSPVIGALGSSPAVSRAPSGGPMVKPAAVELSDVSRRLTFTAGQRVDREKLSIDATKSFVRSFGVSPSSEVKKVTNA